MPDLESVFKQHAYDCPAVDDWIDAHIADIDRVRAFTPIAEMRGMFTRSKLSQCYNYQFTPNLNGSYRAVVIPVTEHGRIVDIAAFRQSAAGKKLDVWGTVTGAGRFLNRDAIYNRSRIGPLDICQSWWHWLRLCGGVLPLRVDAMPELRAAGDVAVSDSAHALQLLYEAYLYPTNAEPCDAVWKAASIEGRRRIFVDDGSDEKAAA